MDRRNQRTQTKMEAIKRAALELFAAHGADKVSMDEIAAKAAVSKVTVYKYFGSKEALYAEVVNLYIDETLAATEKIFDSDMDFLQKLKVVLQAPTNTPPLVSWDYLQQVWEKDGQLARNLQQKVKAQMYRFFEEGKRKGYIEESLSFDLLYLYSEIFRAGCKAKSIDLESVLVDKEAVEKLLNLFFFGIIKKK